MQKIIDSNNVNLAIAMNLFLFSLCVSCEKYKAVDELALIDSGNREEIISVSRKAMEVWFKDLPDIQVVQFLTRPAMSTKYWTNWPQADNGYMNGLFTHLGFHMILQNLEPVE